MATDNVQNVEVPGVSKKPAGVHQGAGNLRSNPLYGLVVHYNHLRDGRSGVAAGCPLCREGPQKAMAAFAEDLAMEDVVVLESPGTDPARTSPPAPDSDWYGDPDRDLSEAWRAFEENARSTMHA